jgi:hypothetical protein
MAGENHKKAEELQVALDEGLQAAKEDKGVNRPIAGA